MARRRKKKGAPQIELPMDSIEDASLVVEAQRRYLNYALSVITSRALPDVRDGAEAGAAANSVHHVQRASPPERRQAPEVSGNRGRRDGQISPARRYRHL